MSQYVIDIKNDQQADALIRYLKSLDFIELKAIKPDRKKLAADDAKSFLTGLPNQKGKQSDVSRAVKTIRKKHGYE